MDGCLNATHDPARRSWVETANDPANDFPIQNLPFGRWRGGRGNRCGIAIGDLAVDLGRLAESGLIDGDARAVAAASAQDLGHLFELGNRASSVLRREVSNLLEQGAVSLVDRPQLLVERATLDMRLPTSVRSFTDMCASTFHIGRRRGNDERGEPICPPVFRTLPVGYDGRATSVVVSGTPVCRPNGQWQDASTDTEPRFGPEPRQDYELEMGAWLAGPRNDLGQPFALSAAEDRLFGFCLLNDWSARGIQMWENMLGPFLGKSIATTVSPWVVTGEALAPFRAPAFARPQGDPPVPAHLFDRIDQSAGHFDIRLRATLDTASMREHDFPPHTICESNFQSLYWTWAQMLTHHASNGCSVGAGDLIGSGTCSGPELSAAACLLERTWAGAITLPGCEVRKWLADGDRVTIRARAERAGFVGIGFGEASGMILPAPAWPN